MPNKSVIQDGDCLNGYWVMIRIESGGLEKVYILTEGMSFGRLDLRLDPFSGHCILESRFSTRICGAW